MLAAKHAQSAAQMCAGRVIRKNSSTATGNGNVAASCTAGDRGRAVVAGSERLDEFLFAVAGRFVPAGVRREYLVHARGQPGATGDVAAARRADCPVEPQYRLVAASEGVR